MQLRSRESGSAASRQSGVTRKQGRQLNAVCRMAAEEEDDDKLVGVQRLACGDVYRLEADER